MRLATARASRDAGVRVATTLVVSFAIALAAGCARPAAEGTPDAGAAPTAWSRAAAPHVASSSAVAASALPAAPDPGALGELIAAAPKEQPPTTDGDGGTTVGTATGEPDGGAPPDASTERARAPSIAIGAMEVAPPLSSPAVEQASRQQLYWGLVQHCRDPEGKLLPPDAITLHFTIDPDGYIAASSIVATAPLPRFEEAARCMRRELAGATFRAPASGRGTSTNVTATVPSVD